MILLAFLVMNPSKHWSSWKIVSALWIRVFIDIEYMYAAGKASVLVNGNCSPIPTNPLINYRPYSFFSGIFLTFH